MDVMHRYHTPSSFRWVRAEHLCCIAALSGLLVPHLREVRWGRFVLAFVLIDLVGYVPGAVAFRRTASGRISPVYHHLYNLTHSFMTAGLAVALWAVLAGGPEWAMLAVPIHLCGDRGLFGNTYKPTELPFEPHGPDSGRGTPRPTPERGEARGEGRPDARGEARAGAGA